MLQMAKLVIKFPFGLTKYNLTAQGSATNWRKAMTTITNSKGGTLEIPAKTLQDYIIQILDNDEKLKEIKKFYHVCRKTKNCDCLGVAVRTEHNAIVDAQIARNLANPIFKQRFGC